MVEKIISDYELVINGGRVLAKLTNLGKNNNTVDTVGTREISQAELNAGKIPVKELDFNQGNTIGLLSPTPDPTLNDREQRDVLMIAGPSGSGKSTYAGEYAKNYVETFPNNDVVIFSEVQQDKAYDNIFDNINYKIKKDYDKLSKKERKNKPYEKKEIIRFVLDKTFVENQLEGNNYSVSVEDLRDCLVIFDDTDTISNKDARKLVFDLRENCLQTGRHQRISMIITVHQPMGYGKTRNLILESTSVTLFTKGSGKKNMRNFMKTYMGFENNEINAAMNLPGRWVCMGTLAPSYTMYQTGIYLN